MEFDGRTIIEATRDGRALTRAEIDAWVRAIVEDEVPDYQVAAWLMAAYCRGLTRQEVVDLTRAMAYGGKAPPSPLGAIDKHSSGGVGDKTTLALLPLVASLGVPVAKMSGRGLGHTGGTLDKLESIPGFRVRMTRAEVEAQMEEVGVAVLAQTRELAPADGKLYALRDLTGTVESPDLIASSILSKKLASGARRLLLDIKMGSGAFMPDRKAALDLSHLLVDIGEKNGVATRALVTNMDQPLGFAVGNAIEVLEAIDTLSGRGPEDFTTLVETLATHAVLMVKGGDEGAAWESVRQAMAGGAALDRMLMWVRRQGGDADALAKRALPLASVERVVPSPTSGVVTRINARAVGEVVMALGAGRRRKEDAVDPGVGLVLTAKVGGRFEAGKPMGRVWARSEAAAALAIRRTQDAVHFGTDAQPLPVVLDVVTAASVTR